MEDYVLTIPIDRLKDASSSSSTSPSKDIKEQVAQLQMKVVVSSSDNNSNSRSDNNSKSSMKDTTTMMDGDDNTHDGGTVDIDKQSNTTHTTNAISTIADAIAILEGIKDYDDDDDDDDGVVVEVQSTMIPAPSTTTSTTTDTSITSTSTTTAITTTTSTTIPINAVEAINRALTANINNAQEAIDRALAANEALNYHIAAAVAVADAHHLHHRDDDGEQLDRRIPRVILPMAQNMNGDFVDRVSDIELIQIW